MIFPFVKLASLTNIKSQPIVECEGVPDEGLHAA